MRTGISRVHLLLVMSALCLRLSAFEADIAIIGGGCAGLSAAFTVGYLRHKAVVFMGDMPGGQLMGSLQVENIPGLIAQPGYQVIEQLERQVREVGVRCVSATIVGLERAPDGWCTLTTTAGDRWRVRAVILAMGGIPRTLGIAGESALMNTKIFTCALCDGQQAVDRTVYVVGGGDASVDAICTLHDFGMRACHLLVRSRSMRASPALQERLRRCSVAIEYETSLVEVHEVDQGLELVIMTPHGREVRYADRLFYAIGHQPNTYFDWLRPYVECDLHGYIKVDAHQCTRTSNIFAAGDIASPYFHQASYAIGCAQLAAKSAVDYLAGHY